MCLEDRVARVQPGHVDGLIFRVHGAGLLDITNVMSGVDISVLFKIFVTFYNLSFDWQVKQAYSTVTMMPLGCT